MNAAELHGDSCSCDSCFEARHDVWVAQQAAFAIANWIEREIENGAERGERILLAGVVERIRRGDWRR